MPLVSIIIPLHNRAAELPQTLGSVLAQTFADWEAVVVDDHSTDGAIDVARAFAEQDKRFRVVPVADAKRGAPAARNCGLALASGDLVVFLDSDDLLAATCLARRVAFMRDHPSLDFCVSRCQLFRDAPGDMPMLWNADTGDDDLDRLLRMDVPWQTTGPTWRRKSLAKFVVGATPASPALIIAPPGAKLDHAGDAGVAPTVWDEAILSGQDWEFHIRAIASGLKYERLDATDCYWRIATVDRESIGKTSFGVDHARARPAVVRKMFDFLAQKKLLTDARRQSFAALHFAAAENLAYRVSRKEGRAVWREARTLGLIDGRRWRQADRYLLAKRWPGLAERMRQRIERDWPIALLPGRRKFFNLAPIDADRAPAISVITSAYNNAAYVRAAVESILNQTFRDFEFIIIDDGSTDGTGEVLQRFADGDCRIRLVRRSNKGLTVSLNEALSLARGELIARMDSDDVAHPLRFEKQVAYLRDHQDVVALGTRIELIDPFDAPIDRPEHKLAHGEIDADLMRGLGWAIVHPTTMMRAAAVRQVGGYRPHYNGCEDLDLFLRLAQVGTLANLPDVLLKYRQHLASVNRTKFQMQQTLTRELLAETAKRRGVAEPIAYTGAERQQLDPHHQHLFWGWMALRGGHAPAAQQHAFRALRKRPFSVEAWKLLRSGLRGH